MSNRDSLEQSVAAASHLDDRDLAAIDLARSLADLIDEWDTIVAWAKGDLGDAKGRPAVPQHDNVTRASYLKVLESLGLTPMSRKAIDAARFANPTGGTDDDSNAPAAPAEVTSAEEFRRRAAERRSS